MRIGKYELFPIETGRFKLDGGAMFGIVPKVMWDKLNPADERNRIELALRALLISGNGRKILVDTGIGEKWSEKYIDIYGIDHTRCSLESSLRKYGFEIDDITDVILTHLHFDHAGGGTYFDREDGILKPTFKNATYYIQGKNLKLAMNPNEKDRASYLPENYQPLIEFGQLEVVDGEFEIFDGIEIITSDGHTIGQQLVKISDGETTLLYCGDLIPTSSHIPIPYVMAYDLQPLLTMEEKRKLLDRAVEENWILFFEHDPFIDAATVKRGKRGAEIEVRFNIDQK
jgi:glyoxylase-like metal-dependent hydrolase (beta-lactamase superfamily II)